MNENRLILASSSPRRAQLLRDHGFHFDVIAPPEEEPDPLSINPPPARWAEFLSQFKAQSVARLLHEGLVLAADTFAALDDQIFGKPRDRADAERILRRIMGTTHQVITGVTLLDAANGWKMTRHDVTSVVMRNLSDQEIESYLDGNEWAGKAGAYGIQDSGDAFIERIEGSFSNVVGLPMELLGKMIAEYQTIASRSSIR